MKNILITGAGGFIGYNLSHFLVKKGYAVTGIDLHYPDEPWAEQPAGQFRFIKGDFRDRKLMQDLLTGVDTVAHLASAHLQIKLDASEYWDVNVHALRPLLEQVHNAGVSRFVHVSSVGVYGNLRVWPADENTTAHPQSIYGETKLAGEKEVQSFGAETGLPIVILRPAWVYGLACPRTRKLFRALRKRRFLMIGDGNTLRHPVYIDDMNEALRLAIETDAAVGELFIIGGDSAVTTNELIDTFCNELYLPVPKIRIPYWMGIGLATSIEALAVVVRREPPISRRTLEFFDTNNAFDITKARQRLGFSPVFSLADGLRETRDWLGKYA